MRLFVAIAVSPAVQDSIARSRAPLMARAPQAHWARPESWHWTLQFLGERPEADFPAITTALATVLQPGFRLELRGLGGFPPQGRLRTIWIGLANPAPVVALSKAVAAALAPTGFIPEDRAYSPHLTLARAGPRGSELAALRDELSRGEPAWGEQDARDFTLFWSRPQQGRFHYEPLRRFRLWPPSEP